MRPYIELVHAQGRITHSGVDCGFVHLGRLAMEAEEIAVTSTSRKEGRMLFVRNQEITVA